MSEIESRAAIAFVMLMDHLARMLAHKGILTYGEHELVLKKAVSFLSSSPVHQIREAADVLERFSELGLELGTST